MKHDNILILGGSGFLGRALAAKLVERSGGAGGRVIVPTHRQRFGRFIQSLPTVEMVQADVHDERQLAQLVSRCDAVVNLIAILHGDEAAFRQVHVELPAKIAAACTSAGVRRLVHVSAIGAAANAPSMYLRSKAGGEAALQSAGLDLTVLRPSVMFGNEDRFMNQFAKLQRFLPVMPLAGAFARFQPVWVDDVATAIVHCIDRSDTIGQTFECTGPEVYTLAEMVKLAGRWSGNERPILPLTDGFGHLQAATLELFSSNPPLSRDNLDSMRVASVASNTLPNLNALGITSTALDAVAPLYLGAATAGRGKLNVLRTLARRN